MFKKRKVKFCCRITWIVGKTFFQRDLSCIQSVNNQIKFLFSILAMSVYNNMEMPQNCVFIISSDTVHSDSCVLAEQSRLLRKLSCTFMPVCFFGMFGLAGKKWREFSFVVLAEAEVRYALGVALSFPPNTRTRLGIFGLLVPPPLKSAKLV